MGIFYFYFFTSAVLIKKTLNLCSGLQCTCLPTKEASGHSIIFHIYIINIYNPVCFSHKQLGEFPSTLFVLLLLKRHIVNSINMHWVLYPRYKTYILIV